MNLNVVPLCPLLDGATQPRGGKAQDVQSVSLRAPRSWHSWLLLQGHKFDLAVATDTDGPLTTTRCLIYQEVVWLVFTLAFLGPEPSRDGPKKGV